MYTYIYMCIYIYTHIFIDIWVFTESIKRRCK